MLEECCDSTNCENVTDDYLYTSLHLAYLCGPIQIAHYLIQHGADVYAVDKYGHTVIRHMTILMVTLILLRIQNIYKTEERYIIFLTALSAVIL